MFVAFGKFTEVNPRQAENAYLPMLVTFGKSTEVNALQL